MGFAPYCLGLLTQYGDFTQIGMLLDSKPTLIFVLLSLTDMSVSGSDPSRLNKSFTTSEDHIFFCYMTNPFNYIYITYSITTFILVVPILFLVLYLGLQQWQQHSAEGTTNADIFTIHLAIIEVFGTFGSMVACTGIFKWDFTLLIIGMGIFNLTWYGETYFHILTCMECYLAVVYPIRYQSLRREWGITIRNVSLACVWLLSSAGVVMMIINEIFAIMDIVVCILSFVIMIYCGLSVVYTLGKKSQEKNGNNDRGCKTKLKAYHIFLAMIAVILMRLFVSIIWSCFNISKQNICHTIIFETWLSLPGRLMLPVHFLHRAGIFSCCKNDEK